MEFKCNQHKYFQVPVLNGVVIHSRNQRTQHGTEQPKAVAHMMCISVVHKSQKQELGKQAFQKLESLRDSMAKHQNQEFQELPDLRKTLGLLISDNFLNKKN